MDFKPWLAAALLFGSACQEILIVDLPLEPDAGKPPVTGMNEPPPFVPPPEQPQPMDSGVMREPEKAPPVTTPPLIDAGPAPAVAPPPTAAAPRSTPPVEPDDKDAGAPKPPEPPRPERLPKVVGKCPQLPASGRVQVTGNNRSLNVQVYMARDAASKPAPSGPLVMYFHSLGGVPAEVGTGFGQAAIDQVIAAGGVVAAFESSLCLTCDPREGVIWYPQDDPVIDQFVACALQQAKVDPRRIHAVGFSSGGMHSMHLALARSNYIASVVSYSGGLTNENRNPVDPDNPVSAMLSYGRSGVDLVAADFRQQSYDWYDIYQPRGYYVMMCDHAGGHEIPTALAPHVYKFLLDHPYKVSPEPYSAMVPAQFPAYCRNKPANR